MIEKLWRYERQFKDGGVTYCVIWRDEEQVAESVKLKYAREIVEAMTGWQPIRKERARLAANATARAKRAALKAGLLRQADQP